MIKSGFDLVAPYYDLLASLVFGRAIRQAQTAFLHKIPAQACILIIGGGTGWLLPEIFARTNPQKILYLEASGKMLNLARQKVEGAAQAACLEFRLGTEKDIRPGEKFDVIISHFLLDLFLPTQLAHLTDILFQSIRPGGLWLVTDFVQTPGSGFRQLWRNILTKSMYLFFRLMSNISAASLPDWQNILTRYRLMPVKSAYFYHHMIKSVLYQKE